MSARRVLVAAVLATAALALAGIAGAGGGDAAALRVELDNAAGLVARDEVRIAGVVVGEIERLEVTPDTHVVATLALRDGVAVPRSTRAEVRAANLFGGKFLALVPGTGPPAPAGWTVPRSRTSAPVEIDDVLDTLGPDTRSALATLLGEAGLGLGGRGRDLGRLLGTLPQTLPEVTRLLEDLRADRRTLGPLVQETDRVVAPLAADRRRIGRFVTLARHAASGFAREERALAATIGESPATLRQLRSTLTDLEETAVGLGPAADALRATAAPLDRTLRELPAVERNARDALSAATRVGRPLAGLGRTTTRVLRRAHPTLASLAGFAEDLAPVSRIAADEIRPLIGVLQGWARATQDFDGLGHFFRGEFVLNADDVVRTVTDRPARTRRVGRPPTDGRATTPREPGPTAPDAPAARRPLPKIEIPGLPALDLGRILELGAPADAGRGDGARGLPLLDHLLGP